MLTPYQIKAAKEEAQKKLQEKIYKEAVDAHIQVLKGRKAHFFPKKLVLQWPWRLEEWVKPNGYAKSR